VDIVLVKRLPLLEAQNATQQINNMPFTAIYVTLLGALLLVVLAVLFYARKAARKLLLSS
jgi:hypothetical protein